MMGREAYQNPGILAQVDRQLFGRETPVADPVAVVRSPLHRSRTGTGHLSGTHYAPHAGPVPGIPGARQWRRHLSENAHKPGADVRVLEAALALVADRIVQEA